MVDVVKRRHCQLNTWASRLTVTAKLSLGASVFNLASVTGNSEHHEVAFDSSRWSEIRAGNKPQKGRVKLAAAGWILTEILSTK